MPNRGAFIRMLAEMASALVYGDCCPDCHETRFPLRVAHLSADQAVARYECPCGRQWGCSWTRSLRVLGAMS